MWIPLVLIVVCFIVLALVWLGKPEDGKWCLLALLLLCTLSACERIPSLWENCATRCNGDEFVSHFKPRTVDGNMAECECMAEKDARWR